MLTHLHRLERQCGAMQALDLARGRRRGAQEVGKHAMKQEAVGAARHEAENVVGGCSLLLVSVMSLPPQGELPARPGCVDRPIKVSVRVRCFLFPCFSFPCFLFPCFSFPCFSFPCMFHFFCMNLVVVVVVVVVIEIM